ncbi:hypothetical protein [Nodularia sphaerocarpa]|uniref:hypothetical protein n=1 Tax=Nodularia sphaerocarpa TaxID=137816 RepID=UPI001EFA9C5A|nr:hypothetical protein [Nodularia sphaerocarpa]MDB9372216.1 hypothetical protein [Nodularia sphaerocarpa CS-585]MDB9376788.1 hypothetical protein [Nodularia sphaerocarpa CS-585A2]ULP74616.1 hypothetical protein BDGGKGIB_04285 [Nodularia sphaerocarpa UHCC 0038]
MSVQSIQSDLIVELSTDEQQMLSGGQRGRSRYDDDYDYCPKRVRVKRCGFYYPRKYGRRGYDEGGGY